MDKIEHSPVPWELEVRVSLTTLLIKSGEYQIGEVYGRHDNNLDEVNAAFIVKAVNNHDKLVAALREFVDECNKKASWDKVGGAYLRATKILSALGE